MRNRKYNTLLIKYTTLLEEYSESIKGDVEILKENARLKNCLDEANEIIRKYKAKYGKLEGGKFDAKNRSKKW